MDGVFGDMTATLFASDAGFPLVEVDVVSSM
jgi:hypothetical protein